MKKRKEKDLLNFSNAGTKLLILVFLLGVSAFFDFSFEEDVGSVLATAEDLSNRKENQLGIYDNKAAFYYLIIFPFLELSNSYLNSLVLVKLLIVTIFYVYFLKNLKNLKELIWCSVIILVTPAFIEFYQEYLRQGLAIAIIYLGMSIDRKILKFIFFGFGILLHPLTVFFVVLSILPILDRKATRLASNPRNITLIITSGIFVSYFIAIDYTSFLADIFNSRYLESVFLGKRENIFGYLTLLSYSCLLGYFLVKCPGQKLFVAFCFGVAILSLYPLISDYGRALLTLSLLHLFALPEIKNETKILHYVVTLFHTSLLYI